MQQTLFEVKTPDGKLLDRANCINCPDLADQRIARVLKYYPDAVVRREDFEDVYGTSLEANDEAFRAGTW